MKNKKRNPNSNKERHVCQLYAVTKTRNIYLGYYLSIISGPGNRIDECEYAGDFRYLEIENWELVKRTIEEPYTLCYREHLKAYLRNPENDNSDIKRIIDILGVNEEIEWFFARYEHFIIDEFGETALEPEFVIIKP